MTQFNYRCLPGIIQLPLYVVAFVVVLPLTLLTLAFWLVLPCTLYRPIGRIYDECMSMLCRAMGLN